jgi:hypothetical protein
MIFVHVDFKNLVRSRRLAFHTLLKIGNGGEVSAIGIRDVRGSAENSKHQTRGCLPLYPAHIIIYPMSRSILLYTSAELLQIHHLRKQDREYSCK